MLSAFRSHRTQGHFIKSHPCNVYFVCLDGLGIKDNILLYEEHSHSDHGISTLPLANSKGYDKLLTVGVLLSIIINPDVDNCI